MVAPAATAMLISSKIATAVALSVLLALGEAWIGLVLAFYSAWPASFWTTLLGAACYLTASSLLPQLLHYRSRVMADGRA